MYFNPNMNVIKICSRFGSMLISLYEDDIHNPCSSTVLVGPSDCQINRLSDYRSGRQSVCFTTGLSEIQGVGL